MSALPFAPGEILAEKYRIERVLGEGGQGFVLAAQHLTLGGHVAIKVLRPEIALDTETVARFLREARASVRMKGEHVTRVLDVASLPSGLPYIVMEHLDGDDLSTIIGTTGWLPVPLAVDYALQTCEALAEAHALGIVHRDIKPSNLFLTTRADGSACIKVLDFGISKAMATPDGRAPELNLTQTQAVLGSPQYMAPEQMRSSKRVDGRTDIWAIGATLHELLTGLPPFDAKSMPELFAMILEDAPPRLCERRPDIPPALEAAVARCLEKDPGKRFADVHELARALAPMGSLGAGVVERIGRVGLNAARSSDRLSLHDAGSAPAIDLSRTEKTEPAAMKKERPRFLIAGAAVLIMALVGAGVVVSLQRIRAHHPSPVPTQVAAPPADSVIPPADLAAPAGDEPPPPPTTQPDTAPAAPLAVSAAPKAPDAPRPKAPPGPQQHAQRAPSASATTAPTATATATATAAPSTTSLATSSPRRRVVTI